MFDGDKLLPLTDAQIRNVTKRVHLRTMPPQAKQEQFPPLSDDENNLLVERQDELRGPQK
jgi:hypothetical protein